MPSAESYIIDFVSKIFGTTNEDLKPKPMIECRERLDLFKWKEAIEIEFHLLNNMQVFPVGYNWVFI